MGDEIFSVYLTPADYSKLAYKEALYGSAGGR